MPWKQKQESNKNATETVDRFASATQPGFSRLQVHLANNTTASMTSQPVLTRSQPSITKHTTVPNTPLLSRADILNLSEEEQEEYLAQLKQEVDEKTNELLEALQMRDLLIVQNDQCRDRISVLLKSYVEKEGKEAAKHLQSANVLDGTIKKRRRRFSLSRV